MKTFTKITLAALLLCCNLWAANANDLITFTWKGNNSKSKTIIIQATSGKQFTVDWGNGITDNYTGKGLIMTLSSPAYGNTNNYNVTISAVNADCYFDLLYVNSNNVSSLDVSGATELANLKCVNNQLTSLNISNNPALTCLYCYENQLTSLNVSNNPELYQLKCFSNQLTSLDVSNNPELTTLHCYENQLTSLDVSKNTALGNLHCYDNYLTSLDITNNIKLGDLRCSNNELASLIVPDNTVLNYFECSDNCLLLSNLFEISQKSIFNYIDLGLQTRAEEAMALNTEIDYSSQSVINDTATVFTIKKYDQVAIENFDYTLNNGKLVFLTAGIYSVKLTNAAIISDGSSVSYTATYRAGIVVPDNISFTWKGNGDSTKTFSLNASSNKNFIVDWGNNFSETFTAGQTKQVLTSPVYNDTLNHTVTITADDEWTRFTYLYVSGKNLSKLDVRGAFALTNLNCSENQLTSLDVSNNPALIELYCSENQITCFDVSNAPELFKLNCSKNQLTSLDVSNNPELNRLYCYQNQLTSLDVSNNTALFELSCSSNQLTSLDLTNNTAIEYLYCVYCSLIVLKLNCPNIKIISCYYNSLPLSCLYSFYGQISGATCRSISGQTQDVRFTLLNVKIDYSSETAFYGINTVFEIKKNGSTAAENTDYTLNGGQLVFLTEGTYTVTLTNNAISAEKDSDYPATYTATYIAAPSQITYTWQGNGAGTRNVLLRATEGTSFTVDWGNGSIGNYTGNGDTDVTLTSPAYGDNANYPVTITASGGECVFTSFYCANDSVSALNVTKAAGLIYLYCSSNQISTLDVSNNTSLVRLVCHYNQIEALNVRNSLDLNWLYCYDNQITALDVSNNTNLTRLYCYNNRIPLSDLYVASRVVTSMSYKKFGAQTQPLEDVLANEIINFSSQNAIGGAATGFAITTDGVAAIEGVDYTLAYGILTFLSNGSYTVTLTNDSILTYTSTTYYATYTASYNVSGGIDKDEISFTWAGDTTATKTISVKASEGTSFTVDWGNDSISVFSMVESGVTTFASSVYESDNDYAVTIRAANANCRLTYLSAGSKGISTLDVSKAPLLKSLYCWDNELTSLNVSNNTELTVLNCHTNQLTSLDVSNNTKLEALYCQVNKLSGLTLNNNSLLERLYCYDNRIPLSDLYIASELITTTSAKFLGEQVGEPQSGTVGVPINYSSEYMFGITSTLFYVTKLGSKLLPVSAVLNTDYTINFGIITFLKENTYAVQMVNSAITSDDSYPVSYTVSYKIKEETTPETLAINNQTYSSGTTSCEGATQTIVVAEDGDDVVFQNGSGTTLIAGQSVRFLPGTKIQPGAYVHAYITTDGSFCDAVSTESIVEEEPVAEKSAELLPDDDDGDQEGFTGVQNLKVYPNPSTGRVTVQTSGFEGTSKVFVYNNTGKTVYVGEMGQSTSLDLSNLGRGGVFLVKTVNEKTALVQRIIIK